MGLLLDDVDLSKLERLVKPSVLRISSDFHRNFTVNLPLIYGKHLTDLCSIGLELKIIRSPVND